MDEPRHLSKKERRELRRAGQLPPMGDQSKRSIRRWLTWAGVVFGLGLLVWGLGYLAQSDANPASQGADKNLPPITDADHIRGDRSAPAILIEYSDLQCPACKAYEPMLSQLSDELGERLAVIYRHFPLTTIHQNAEAAALAAEAAASQDAFWPYHDLLFDRQSDWSNLPNPRQTLIDYAQELGLDLKRFETDMESAAAKDKVNADLAGGNKVQVQGTPTFFLNGRRLKNPKNFAEFKALIEDEIAANQTSENANSEASLNVNE